MADGDSPKLSLVPQADPAEREKAEALRDLEWETRELAANLLRVIRGAGRPSELPQQIISLGEAILEVNKTARAWAIWSAMEETLQSGLPERWEELESSAYRTPIIRGSLQLVASTLLNQHAQQSAGDREIGEGIRELEERRERQRKRWAEERAGEALRRARRATKAKKRPVTKKAPTKAAKPKSETIEAEEPERPKSTADFMKARQRELRGED